MKTAWLVLPINPEPWAIGTAGVSRTGGKLRAFVSPNAQLKNYQEAIRSHIKQWYPDFEMVNEECELLFYFYRRLDRYTTESDRASMRHVADATNMQKALEDAIQGVILTNDRNVKRVTSEVISQTVDTEPGIIIGIRWPYLPKHNQEIPMEVMQWFHRMSDSLGVLDLENTL